MKKFTRVFSSFRSNRSETSQPLFDLPSLTREQALAVSAGTGSSDTTKKETKETVGEKPQITATTNSTTSDTTPTSGGRPPFN